MSLSHEFFGIDMPQRVVLKYEDYIGKQRIPAGRSLGEIFFKSLSLKMTPQMRQAVTYALKLKEPLRTWARQARISNQFSLIFIGQANRIEEICSYRSMREMAKSHQHHLLELGEIKSPTEGEQFHKIYKFKNRSKIGGGLIRQERCPLDRWRKK